MIQSILLQIYFKCYQYYLFLWNYLFTWVDQIIFIYYINENNKKNITLNYYLNYGLDKYQNGIYYANIYNINGSNHITHNGNISGINILKITDQMINPPKRKNILLLNNDVPVNVDLGILDNYKMNINENHSLTNLGKILQLIGIKCTHILIIQHIPFNKKIVHVDEVDINHIYH